MVRMGLKGPIVASVQGSAGSAEVTRGRISEQRVSISTDFRSYLFLQFDQKRNHIMRIGDIDW